MAASETLEQIMREGRERLNPSLANPSWLVLTERRRLFRAWLTSIPGQQLNVLDIGGRIQPYRHLLEGRFRRYLAVDVRQTPLVDVIARGEQLPLKENEFDVVLCTQVLEYVPELRQVIAEIHRVLKPGGTLLLSVPAMFPTDSDQDLWRFTPGSLRLLLSSFRDVEIRAEGSSIHGLFRTIAVWITCFARPAVVAGLLRFTLVPFLNLSAVCLAWAVPTRNEQFAANFSAFAHK
jgi:SAM-dependent methyltransferase